MIGVVYLAEAWKSEEAADTKTPVHFFCCPDFHVDAQSDGSLF
jgi:hypothetical protein